VLCAVWSGQYPCQLSHATLSAPTSATPHHHLSSPLTEITGGGVRFRNRLITSCPRGSLVTCDVETDEPRAPNFELARGTKNVGEEKTQDELFASFRHQRCLGYTIYCNIGEEVFSLSHQLHNTSPTLFGSLRTNMAPDSRNQVCDSIMIVPRRSDTIAYVLSSAIAYHENKILESLITNAFVGTFNICTSKGLPTPLVPHNNIKWGNSHGRINTRATQATSTTRMCTLHPVGRGIVYVCNVFFCGLSRSLWRRFPACIVGASYFLRGTNFSYEQEFFTPRLHLPTLQLNTLLIIKILLWVRTNKVPLQWKPFISHYKVRYLRLSCYQKVRLQAPKGCNLCISGKQRNHIPFTMVLRQWIVVLSVNKFNFVKRSRGVELRLHRSLRCEDRFADVLIRPRHINTWATAV
ncbi:hypothetical protein J6590_026381, partial [Homalodisca vitripennis]